MSVDGRGHVVVWNLDTLQEEAAFDCDKAVGAVGIQADNNTLAAGDYQGQITFWNVSARQCLGKTLPRYKDAVAAARFSHDTRALAHVGPEHIAPPAEPVPPFSMPLFLNESAGLGPSPNKPKFEAKAESLVDRAIERQDRGSLGSPAENTDEPIVLEQAPAAGLHDLQTRIEALEQSIDAGDGGKAARKQSPRRDDQAPAEVPQTTR